MKIKITSGFVRQVFDDDGNIVSQEFTAGDSVDYENAYGEAIKPFPEYFPFDMVQPEESIDVTYAPTTCPECETDDISADQMEQSEHEAWCEVTCNQCNHTWKEIYTFDRIE